MEQPSGFSITYHPEKYLAFSITLYKFLKGTFLIMLNDRLRKQRLNTITIFPDPLLLYLMDKFDIIPGKKALQQLIYFINLHVGRYKFKWNRFGLFSEELSYILDDLVFENYVSIIPENHFTKLRYYNLCLTESGKRYLEKVRIDKKTKRIISYVVDLLRDKNPREMELMASVHYIATWAKCSDKKLTLAFTYKLIRDLKPDSGFSKADVMNTIQDLEKYKLI